MGFHRNEISVKAKGGTELMRDLLESRLSPELLDNFQIFMSRPRDFDYTKIRIIQCHDLAEDPESAKFRDQEFRDSFHKLVFISNWQYQRYQLIHNIPYNDNSIVLETGIEPAFSNSNGEDFHQYKDKEKIRLVYTSTPQRGLDILVPVFETLAEKNPNIHLDVFSSFKIYGWDDADKQFEPLYDRIRNHPQMTYHGFTSNDKLREHLTKCHIFAYPSTWLETSCRAMLEAMSAGLVCVHPNYGALAETSGCLNVMYQGDIQDKNRHAQIFAGYLQSAINFVKEDQHISMTRFNKTFVDSRFNIDVIVNRWEMMLKDLLKKYPTVESRQKKEQVFKYKVL